MVTFEAMPNVTVPSASLQTGMLTHQPLACQVPSPKAVMTSNFLLYEGSTSLAFGLLTRTRTSGFASLSSAVQPASQRGPVFSLAK